MEAEHQRGCWFLSPGEQGEQDGSSGAVERWSDSRFILKAELTKLAGRLDAGGERKR